MEWKWTKGEPYERSRRIIKNENNESKENFSKEIETSAYSSALNFDENTWDILNREKSDNLEFTKQIGNNPFFSENNYVEDIAMSDKFLKPVNTTQDRVKNTVT